MTVLFDGSSAVHYGFVSLAPEGDSPDVALARAGQKNGLCSAGTPGMLSMVTGLHTGDAPFRVEVLGEEPPPSDDWEEVAEVSIDITEPTLYLWAFDDGGPVNLTAIGPHRARYHASGMDAAHQADVRGKGEPVIDRYPLQCGPPQ
jgi:hypothetical protein